MFTFFDRHKIIEERKEWIEKQSIYREEEEARKAAQQLREQQKLEEERLRAEREERDRIRQVSYRHLRNVGIRPFNIWNNAKSRHL